MSWRHLCKTPWRCLEDVFKRSWRCLEDVLKTSWRRFEDVWPRQIYCLWSKRLEDVFWRRMSKINMFVLIKMTFCAILQSLTYPLQVRYVLYASRYCLPIYLVRMPIPLFFILVLLLMFTSIDFSSIILSGGTCLVVTAPYALHTTWNGLLTIYLLH